MQPVDVNRLKIWQALSELFVDTEIDDSTFDRVARAVSDTGYSLTRAHHVLWNEVFPVLHRNLETVAGEWAGWSDEWLLEHLSLSALTTVKPDRRWAGKLIAGYWHQVTVRLPQP